MKSSRIPFESGCVYPPGAKECEETPPTIYFACGFTIIPINWKSFWSRSDCISLFSSRNCVSSFVPSFDKLSLISLIARFICVQIVFRYPFLSIFFFNSLPGTNILPFLVSIGVFFDEWTVDVPSLEEPFERVFSMVLQIFKLFVSAQFSSVAFYICLLIPELALVLKAASRHTWTSREKFRRVCATS